MRRSRSRRDGRSPAGVEVQRQATISHARPSHTASLRVSPAKPMRRPRPISRRSNTRAAAGKRAAAGRSSSASSRAGRAAIRVISRQAARESAAKRAVESGSIPYTTSGPRKPATTPVPTASVRARPTGSFISAAMSAPRRHASAATAALTTTDIAWAARNQFAAPASQTGIAARKVGSGSHTSKAARGTSSGGVW